MSDYTPCPHSWVQIEHDRQEGSRGTNELTVLECVKCFDRRTIEEFRRRPDEGQVVAGPICLLHSKVTLVLRRSVRIEAANAEDAVRKATQLLASQYPTGEVESILREVELERIDGLPEELKKS